jgi:RecA/RadA recombinase
VSVKVNKNAKNPFLNELIKRAGNDFATIADDGIVAGDIVSFISTGSYALNALLSGSIFGGIPSNRITGFSAESSTGKTFIVLGAVKEFLASDPQAMVCLFESESAISRDALIGRGIDVERVAVFPVGTVEQFRDNAMRIVEGHMATPEAERPKLMFVLDSLGMLSTEKEIADVILSNGTKDMTRAGLIKAAFRVLTLKLGFCNIPLAVTNHVYAAIGSNSPLPESGGGGGFKYAVSTEITLTKAKYKEGEEQVGIVVTATAKKSRLTVEGTKAKVLIRFDGGLDKYYGLVPIVEAMGIIKKEMGRFVLPDGKKVFEKNIVDKPDILYTDAMLVEIDAWVKKNLCYGGENGNIALNMTGEEQK